MHTTTLGAVSSLIIGFLGTPVLSHPTQAHARLHLQHKHHQRWDLDNNGIPDDCTNLLDGQEACIKADGSTSTFNPNAPTTLPKYDLDHNGIPDECKAIGTASVACLQSNGAWTTFAATTTPAPSPQAGNPFKLAAVVATTTNTADMPRGTLPPAKEFQAQNGTINADGKGWKLERKGVLGFNGQLASKTVNGDKGRSGVLGNQVIWNFGDVMCGTEVSNCGFDMGPAFYGTKNIMDINTQDISNVGTAKFIQPYSADPKPADGCTDWGMDNSNVAALNETHGIVYSWEIWRGCPSSSGYQDRGIGASVITLGEQFPKAERIAPLIAGPEAVQLGLIGIMSAEGYIYSYTVENGAVIVGRAKTTDPNIYSSASAHEFYSPSAKSWIQGIPSKSDASKYSIETAQPGGFACAVYGTAFWSNYFHKYMLFCSLYENVINFYTADRPEGPFSETYTLLQGVSGYGAMVHPEYSDFGSHKSLYVSMGPNAQFDVWRVEFDYDV